jgi:hypothetical protein
MNAIESVAWAILTFEGFRPGTKSWRHRNPGNLRASKMASRIQAGYAVFDSFGKGWDALMFDLSAKFRGAPHTSTGLGPESTIQDLLKVWAPASDGNEPDTYARFVADFLTKSFRRPVTIKTKLKEL